MSTAKKSPPLPRAAPESPPVAAWLLPLVEGCQQDLFTLRLPQKRSLLSGLKEGDGLVLLSADGQQVLGFARIYRIRSVPEETQIFFNGQIKLPEPKPVIELFPTMNAEAQGSIIATRRLEWPLFEEALKTVTDRVFKDLPGPDEKNPHHQAYIRQLLELAVRDDLLGPADGPEEEIVGSSACARYLVGKLAPVIPADHEESPEEESPEGLVPASTSRAKMCRPRSMTKKNPSSA